MSKKNINTASLGFPRIGQNRELKTALEKYWAGNISTDELKTVATEIRQFGWNLLSACAESNPHSQCKVESFHSSGLD